MIKEIQIEDQAIAAQLAEFYELQNKIKELSEELKDMENDYKKFSVQLAPMFETMKELKEKTAEAKSYIIKVEQEGYDRKTHKYKKAYEFALSKLNEATRAVCKKLEEEESTVSKVAARFSIEKLSEATMFDKAKSYVSRVVGFFTEKMKGYFASMDKANGYLAKLASAA
jgi:chromosome segregation ATPase